MADRTEATDNRAVISHAHAEKGLSGTEVNRHLEVYGFNSVDAQTKDEDDVFAHVLREDEQRPDRSVWQNVPVSELVPSDILLLSATDLIYVPADTVVIDARDDFAVTSKLLNGSSIPVTKQAIQDTDVHEDTAKGSASEVQPGDVARAGRVTRIVGSGGLAFVGPVEHLLRTNHIILARSMIVSGSAKVMVVSTGKGTAVAQSIRHGHVQRLDWSIPYDELNGEAKKKHDAKRRAGDESCTRGALTKSAVKRK